MGIVENLEILLLQAGNEFVAPVEHGEKHVDKVDSDWNGARALLDLLLFGGFCGGHLSRR